MQARGFLVSSELIGWETSLLTLALLTKKNANDICLATRAQPLSDQRTFLYSIT